MKYVKTLGLGTMVVMALMASAAGAASATTLDDGKGNNLEIGTKIKGSMVGTAALSSGGTTLVTCTGGALEMATENIGGESATAYATVVAGGLTWSGCSQTIHTLDGGTLEVHHKAEPSRGGTVTASLFKVTVNFLGSSCTYGMSEVKTDKKHFATLTGSDTAAVLDVSATTVKLAGGFLCPNGPKWSATYQVTSPAGLTVTAS